jgi:hypothetical protein
MNPIATFANNQKLKTLEEIMDAENTQDVVTATEDLSAEMIAQIPGTADETQSGGVMQEFVTELFNQMESRYAQHRADMEKSINDRLDAYIAAQSVAMTDFAKALANRIVGEAAKTPAQRRVEQVVAQQPAAKTKTPVSNKPRVAPNGPQI